MTIVRLTDANKEALNRYGNLQNLSLTDALLEASGFLEGNSKTCYIQPNYFIHIPIFG